MIKAICLKLLSLKSQTFKAVIPPPFFNLKKCEKLCIEQ